MGLIPFAWDCIHHFGNHQRCPYKQRQSNQPQKLRDDDNVKYRVVKDEVHPSVSTIVIEIAKANNVTQKEALKQLVEQNLDTMEKTEQTFTSLEKRTRRSSKGKQPAD